LLKNPASAGFFYGLLPVPGGYLSPAAMVVCNLPPVVTAVCRLWRR